MKDIIRINEDDNVVVALRNLNSSFEVHDGIDEIFLLDDIPKGHKIAAQDIKAGDNVIKYGHSIGKASSDIKKGSWVHSHNMKTALDGVEEYEYEQKSFQNNNDIKKHIFQGYIRENGDVGIRNELLVIPTVGCINSLSQNLVDRFKRENNTEHLDDVITYSHPYGCSQLGGDLNNTRTILADIAKHPNIGGALILGLGCENNTVDELKKELEPYDKDRIKFLICQESDDEIKEGLDLLCEISEIMKHDKRESVSIEKLKIGLKCGGSDGFSGITANPLLGKLSDLIIKNGGSAILTEVPEMFGAETILMDRAESKDVFNNITKLINDFKNYYIKNEQPIYENPSPGNKAGGITTLEEKSLGCIQKGGHETIVDVLPYGGKVRKNGLSLLQSPGNDLVSSTALAASGCQLILFTTGRGTPFGTFVPTVKISTNSDIYNKKAHWIDFDGGQVISSDKTLDDLKHELLEYVIKVCSGEFTNNEKNGNKDIAIFKTGVTL